MNEPTMNIERITNLTKSIVKTLQVKGYTLGKPEFDLDSGNHSINVYLVGKIVKRIIYEKDMRKG